jgi:polysaccharide biosynthesis/export protein
LYSIGNKQRIQQVAALCIQFVLTASINKSKLQLLKNKQSGNGLLPFIQHFPIVSFAIFIIITSSCGNVKNLQYLQGSFDTTRLKNVHIPEPVIQKGDLLSITVYSDDPLATAAVTNPMTNNTPMSLGGTGNGADGTSSTGAATLQGFVVNQEGSIQLYKVGSIIAAGKTKKQLADTLASLYANQGLLKNPYVEVRFLSYKITVIGEVNHPGQVSVPTDKLNAFEAIGLAGDITIYGRRDNVLVVRETNGLRSFGQLNLKDPNVFLSPYYYLQQNDMLIVDVGKNKAIVNNQSTFQIVSLSASLLSITAVLISVFRR